MTEEYKRFAKNTYHQHKEFRYIELNLRLLLFLSYIFGGSFLFSEKCVVTGDESHMYKKCQKLCIQNTFSVVLQFDFCPFCLEMLHGAELEKWNLSNQTEKILGNQSSHVVEPYIMLK